MKKLVLSFFILCAFSVVAFAQERTITGTVTSSEDGLPIPGASVRVKEIPGSGVSTGADGKFAIKVGAQGKTLVVSSIAFSSKEVAITGNAVSVVLAPDAQQLGEVVVTGALGIQRQKKDIGYATAKVDSKVLTAAKSVNVANGLQGKVSGLNITTMNSGVFETVKINLRGIRSLTGNNNPMLLLDGVPSTLSYLSTLNPNDIENVNILKGSSAAAIYGPDARNGVIVVTTKKGSATPKVAYSHSSQFTQISFFPKLQEKFGSGGYGVYTPYENWSWGPAFDGSMQEIGHTLPDGSVQTVTYSPTNDRKDFFETGYTMQNDLSYSAKDFYVSVQDAYVTGIVPEDRNRRTGVRLNTSKEYGMFKLGVNVNYINQDYNVFNDAALSDFHTGQGTGGNDGLMDLIFNTPAHIPLTKYKDFENDPYAQYNTYFNDYGLNPYFAIDNWRKQGKQSDLLSNLEMTLKPTDWVSLTWRGGFTSRNIDENSISKGETPTSYGIDRGFIAVPGSVSERAYQLRRYSSELFANFNKKINEDFKLTAIAGTYVRSNLSRDMNVGAGNLVIPEIYNPGNRTGELSGGSTIARSKLFSLYANVGLNYKGWANIEFTGRNDRTSLLSLDNNSYFYPGVNGALVLSDALPSLKGDLLNFLKVYASWNKTGNADINPYLLEATFSQPGGFPYGSLPGFTANNTTYDKNLKPEFINSTEVGLEAGFWGGRVELEGSYYYSKNDNQIIPIAVSSATGYTNAYVNAASFNNKGIDLDLRLKTKNNNAFKPGLNINFSYNDNKVTKIYDGLDEIAIGGFTDASNYAIKNYPAFMFKATDYNRDEQGRVIVDAVTGYPTANPNPQIFGRSLPKYILGINPTFDYKNFNLSMVFEYKGGHYAYSSLGDDMAWTGVSEATAVNNREPFIIPNSVYLDPATNQYVPNNNVPISNVNDFFTGVYRTVGTNTLFSAASWRFREVSLSYNLPQNLLARQKFVKNASIALTGRNLFLWVPKTNMYQDPDFSTTTNSASPATATGTNGVSSANVQGISTAQINPPVRTFGFNLTVNF